MKATGLFLPSQFSDGCILQRDTKNLIYGKDTEAKEVKVTFDGVTYTTTTDQHDRFEIGLPAKKAGGPYTIIVRGSEEKVIQDVWFGEVFLLSGQSNMELPISRVLDVSAKEVYAADERQIRQFLLPSAFRFDASEEYLTDGSWKEATQENIMEFSAVGYFFAKEIYNRYHIPVGLIMTAVGGSKVEAFMSRENLKKFGDQYEEIIHKFSDLKNFNAELKRQTDAAMEWFGIVKEHEVTEYDPRNCFAYPVPSMVVDHEKLGKFSGSLFLQYKVYIENLKEGEEGFLYLGDVIDSDEVWINDVKIGETAYRYPPRKYQIPSGILTNGENVIKVRMVVNQGNGGLVKGMPYYLRAGKEEYSISGDWECWIGKRCDGECPSVLWPPELPVCFYNTRIVPLAKTKVKAALWYQGESNACYGSRYKEMFETMVEEWRKLFGEQIPFLTVQLPNFQEPLTKEKDNGWAALRQEQYDCMKIPGVGMVVTLDVGQDCDLHPQNKKEVGVRLAGLARTMLYQEAYDGFSPIPESISYQGGEFLIQFSHLEEGYRQELNLFEIVEEDGSVLKAKAVREGSKVRVWSDEMAHPRQVRYAWLDSPKNINFYNGKHLPTGSFMWNVTIDR